MVEAASAKREASAQRSGDTVHLRLTLASLLCALLPPFVLGRLRNLALRACGVTLGRGCIFFGMPRLSGPGDVGRRLRIGAMSGFNVDCHFGLEAPITIGRDVSVGHQVRLLTAEGAGGPLAEPLPIVVGDGAWLGARCTVLGGVTIGPGAVVGAGVIVAKDVPGQTMTTGAQSISLARWR